MPANPPYAPQDDAGLQTWALNFTALLTASPATYGLTGGNATSCATAYNLYAAALVLSTNPATRTSVTIADKNAERANMRAVIFPFATTISADAAVADPDKVAIGVNVRVTTRTRASMVGIPLELTLEAQDANGTTVRSQNPLTPLSTERPYGSRGWEINVRIRNAANAADERTYTQIGTRRFATVATAPGESGRVAILKSRWIGAPLAGGAENMGDWSANVTVTLA